MDRRSLRSRKVSERMAVVDEADRRRVRCGSLATCCCVPLCMLVR